MKDLQNKTFSLIPRRRAASEIKLLRLELLAENNSPCGMIGSIWTAAQPTEDLSPEKAAESLGVEVWSPPSLVKSRYQKLQLRYPPDQFVQRHIEWRPSAELLMKPKYRLNWYWKSGLIPLPSMQSQEGAWGEKNAQEGLYHPELIFERLAELCLVK